LRALLDTHAFLWWATDDPQLSPTARDFIRDPNNRLSFSVVSAWEILLKARAGRLPIPGDVGDFVEVRIGRYDLALVELQFRHLIRSYHLPTHHRDPFDHLLIAQAQVEDLPLVTADAQMAKYDVDLIW
jgi:PIN domain nuclease of toxin-antitoxin system